MSYQPATMMPPADDGLDHVLVEAINHHHASRFAEAEKLYRNVLDASPGHAVASFGFGLLCATRGRPLEAIEAYRGAIAMRPLIILVITGCYAETAG